MVNEQFMQDFTETEIPSKDYSLDISNSKINGTVEDLDEIKQTIYFILNTERYEYLIYSWDYGVEFVDLIGQPHSYVIPEVERRITEALVQDERINSVSDFNFERNGKKLHVTFVVSTIYGDVGSEVDVNV